MLNLGTAPTSPVLPLTRASCVGSWEPIQFPVPATRNSHQRIDEQRCGRSPAMAGACIARSYAEGRHRRPVCLPGCWFVRIEDSQRVGFDQKREICACVLAGKCMQGQYVGMRFVNFDASFGKRSWTLMKNLDPYRPSGGSKYRMKSLPGRSWESITNS